MRGKQVKRLKALEFCRKIRDVEKKEALSEFAISKDQLENLCLAKEKIDRLLMEAEEEIICGSLRSGFCDPGLQEIKYVYLDKLYEKRTKLLEDIKLNGKKNKGLEHKCKVANAKYEMVKNKYDLERKSHLNSFFEA